MTALVAAERGANVLLLEKSVHRQCNTELSGGLVQAAGTRFQMELQIHDDPTVMMQDILSINGGCCDYDVLAEICRRSADVVHFLADVVGLELHLDTSVLYKGHANFRMHSTKGELGQELVAGLRKAIRSHPRVTFVDDARVSGLLTDKGEVLGVVAGDARERLGGGATVLSCDGFGGNQDLVLANLPSISGAVYIGSENNTGDGIVWGRAVSAAVDRMTAYQAHSHVNPQYGTRLGGSLPSLGSIIVNKKGARFAAEDQGYSQFAAPLLAQPEGVGVEIFDQRAFDAVWQTGSFRQAYEVGAVRRAATVEELAGLFGLPVESLSEEIDTYNASAVEGKDRFGRTDALRPIAAPFYGSVVTGALVHTQGGLRIDPTCRVLRDDHSHITGLYAAGGTAAGISGDGPDGYMSGNGLIQAFATGLIAGEQITS